MSSLTGSSSRSRRTAAPTSTGFRRGCCAGRGGIAVTLFVFYVLVLPLERLSTQMQPHSERRELLEQLELQSRQVRLVATFEDGETLFAAVCERGLESVVATRTR